MYDSRTDKQRGDRRNKTNRKAKARGERLTGRPTPMLANEAPDLDTRPGLKGVGRIARDRRFGQRDCRDSHEQIADWEAILLDLPEGTCGTCWTSSTTDDSDDGDDGYWPEGDAQWGDPQDLGDIDDTDLDYVAWPVSCSIAEVYDTLGDGFSIEGPTERKEPLKGDNYVRVYELARDLDVPTADLLNWLRNMGEFMPSHMSMVANPVADRLRRPDHADFLGVSVVKAVVTPAMPARVRPAWPNTNPFNTGGRGLNRPGLNRFYDRSL